MAHWASTGLPGGKSALQKDTSLPPIHMTTPIGAQTSCQRAKWQNPDFGYGQVQVLRPVKNMTFLLPPIALKSSAPKTG